MQSFATRTSATFFARHRVLVPALVVLAVATVGFAAAGGVGLVKSWFITIAVNGNVVHTGEIVTDENGQATITLPDGALKDGENEVSIALEGSPDQGSEWKTVTVTDSGGEVIVQVGSQPDPNAPSEGE